MKKIPFKIILLCLCAAIVLCSLTLFTAIISRSSDADTLNPETSQRPAQYTEAPEYTQANTEGCEESAGGRFALQSGYLYFIDSSIKKIPINGGSTSELVPEGDYSFINVLGDYIYYIENGRGIFRCEISGGKPQQLSEIKAEKLQVRTDGMYFLSGGAIWYSSVDGKNEQLIHSGIQTFSLCGDYIVIATENKTYGFDLWAMGFNEPIATEVILYTVKNGVIYAETSGGMLACSAQEDFKIEKLPISFELLPSSIAACRDGIIYSPRENQSVILKSFTTGLEQTVLTKADEFFVINECIIYLQDGLWYASSCNGWQKRPLPCGLPGEMLPSALECAAIELQCDATNLIVGQTTTVNVYIDSAPATSQQLLLLAAYIKDNTVLTVSTQSTGLLISAIKPGETILRVTTAQNNCFAEILFKVE